jgi:hypothetical protein
MLSYTDKAFTTCTNGSSGPIVGSLATAWSPFESGGDNMLTVARCFELVLVPIQREDRLWRVSHTIEEELINPRARRMV